MNELIRKYRIWKMKRNTVRYEGEEKDRRKQLLWKIFIGVVLLLIYVIR